MKVLLIIGLIGVWIASMAITDREGNPTRKQKQLRQKARENTIRQNAEAEEAFRMELRNTEKFYQYALLSEDQEV